MAFWHCPHCGTPQAEAARCWVCKRSSTTCRTCRSFRTAVAGGLGYCALDRRRDPLRGDEVRGCWEAAEEGAPPRPDRHAAVADAPPGPMGGLTWTEVPGGSTDPAPSSAPSASSPTSSAPPARPAIDPPPVGLWGEIEG